MLKILLKKINPITISNYGTEKKDDISNSQSNNIQFDNKENTNLNYDACIKDQFSLDFKEKENLNNISITVSKESTELLYHKRRRLRKAIKIETKKPLISLINNEDCNRSIDEYDNYTDQEYKNDLMNVLKDKRNLFMYNHFPSSYNKMPFFHNIKHTKRNNQVVSSLILQSINLSKDNDPYCQSNNSFYPIKKWSPSTSLRNDFLEQLESKWDYSIANFSIEIILQFVMEHNYSWNYCLHNINKCANYVKSLEKKTSNKYHLRNHRVTKFNHGVFNNDHYKYFF